MLIDQPIPALHSRLMYQPIPALHSRLMYQPIPALHSRLMYQPIPALRQTHQVAKFLVPDWGYRWLQHRVVVPSRHHMYLAGVNCIPQSGTIWIWLQEKKIYSVYFMATGLLNHEPVNLKSFTNSGCSSSGSPVDQSLLFSGYLGSRYAHLCSPTKFSSQPILLSVRQSILINSFTTESPVNQYLLSTEVTTKSPIRHFLIVARLQVSQSLLWARLIFSHPLPSAIPTGYLTVSKSPISTRLGTQQSANTDVPQAQLAGQSLLFASQALLFVRLRSKPIPILYARHSSQPSPALPQTAKPCCSPGWEVSQALLSARHSSQPSPAVRQAQKSANPYCSPGSLHVQSCTVQYGEKPFLPWLVVFVTCGGLCRMRNG